MTVETKRSSSTAPGKGAKWTALIISALIAALLSFSASLKFLHNPEVLQTFKQAQIPQAAIVPLGAIELFCAILFLIPRTTVLGSLLLTGYLGGAIVTNLILHTTVVLPFLLGAAAWGCSWLRVPELRKLLPLR